MILWLQIYDKVHYGKWLPEFWSEMINLPHEIDVHIFFLTPLQENHILQFQVMFGSR